MTLLYGLTRHSAEFPIKNLKFAQQILQTKLRTKICVTSLWNGPLINIIGPIVVKPRCMLKHSMLALDRAALLNVCCHAVVTRLLTPPCYRVGLIGEKTRTIWLTEANQRARLLKRIVILGRPTFTARQYLKNRSCHF